VTNLVIDTSYIVTDLFVKVYLDECGGNSMLDTDRGIEAMLRAEWRQAASDEVFAIRPVLRKARRRLAVRNVAGFMLGRIWLALACLCAPTVTNTRRSHPR